MTKRQILSAWKTRQPEETGEKRKTRYPLSSSTIKKILKTTQTTNSDEHKPSSRVRHTAQRSRGKRLGDLAPFASFISTPLEVESVVQFAGSAGGWSWGCSVF